MRTLIRKMKFRKFRRVFGFVPTFGNGDVDADYAENAVVGARLKQLAVGYRSADQNERAAAGSLRKAGVSGNPAELLEARSNLEYYRHELHLAKIAFWCAHGIAARAGFPVSEKYRDYLSSEYR